MAKTAAESPAWMDYKRECSGKNFDCYHSGNLFGGDGFAILGEEKDQIGTES